MTSEQHALLRRSLIVLGGAIYIALLHVIYVQFIAPIYAYMGYVYEPPGRSVIGIGWLLAGFPLLFMPTAIRRPSQVVYWILYLIVYVPTMMIPLYTLPTTRDLWQFLLALSGCFVLLGTMYAIPTARIPRVRMEPMLFWTMIAVLSAACYALIFARFGFQIRLVALTDVYDLRSAYREDLESNGRLVAYAMAWQGNVLNPLIIGFGLARRRTSFIAAGAIGQLALFSITGQKAVLFSAMFILLLFIAYRRSGKWFGFNAVWGSSLVVIVCALLDTVQNSTLFVSLFVRRFIITSGLLTGYYFDFFSINEKAKYAYSFFSRFFDYPYQATPAFVIGEYYFGSSTTSSNANIWADGFANFGLGGMVAITLIAGGIFWLYDSLMADTDRRLAVLMLGTMSISFASSSLPVILLTHGLGLALLLAFLMPRVRESAVNASTKPLATHAWSAPISRLVRSKGSTAA